MRLSLIGLLLCLSCTAQAIELLGRPSVEMTASNAVIHWVTDVPCGTHARVEPSGVKAVVTDGKKTGTQHSVTISGLRPATRYSVALGSAKVWLATNVFTTTGSQDGAMVNHSGSVEPSRIHSKAPSARESWGNYATLPDHFARHGADFGAKDAEEYARMAWEFRQRAAVEGLPAKMDNEGVLRVYDPETRAFAAYNANGTTRTFFKPNSRDYFERQPGRSVNLKTLQKN